MNLNFVRFLLGAAALTACLTAQTAIDAGRQTKNADFSGAVSTKPFKTGAVLPSLCGAGESFFKTDAPAGKNLYLCTATNTWTQANEISVANSGSGGVELLKGQPVNSAVTARQILTGEGMLLTQQTDTVAVEVDTAITPRYAVAATAPTGGCQAGRDQFVRSGGFPNFYSCVGGVWKPIPYEVTAVAPAACSLGELYYNTADEGLYGCTATDSWTRFNRTGADLTLVGECMITYSCAPAIAQIRTTMHPSATLGHMIAIRVTIPHTIKLARGMLYTTGGGAAESIAAAVYADAGGVPGSKIAGTDLLFNNLSFGAYRQGTWGAGTVVLTPGVYWVGYSTESTTAQFYFSGASQATYGQQLAALTVPGVVTCANLATGSAQTYTLPVSCGTTSAVSSFLDAPLILATASQ
jgi:hypothetical protein